MAPKRSRKAPPATNKSGGSQAAKDEAKKVEKKVAVLEEKIKVGMPSVSLMKSAPLGSLRKHKDWEKYARPLIAELEELLGRRVRLEHLRPGR